MRFRGFLLDFSTLRHWRPNWMICNPCVYKFDYILKMESFSTDSAAVLKQVLFKILIIINLLLDKLEFPSRPYIDLV